MAGVENNFAGFSTDRGNRECNGSAVPDTTSRITNKNINNEQMLTNMKTLSPLTLASLALAAMTLNVSAGEALLSPRGKDLQIKTVAGTDNSPNTVTQNRNVIASPRTLDNQIKTVKGTDSSSSTLAKSCAVGSPKQLEQAGKTSAATCCAVAATCITPMSCCGVAGK